MNLWKRQIPDPIRGLTLERLATQIDAYQNGYLADFALTAEAMECRDDILRNVVTKRKKAVTRHGWEILTQDCSDQARTQRDALEYFYKNLTCSHALRANERGGFQLLAYQMMDAVGKGYAVHEIAWPPKVGRSSNSEIRPMNRNGGATVLRSRLHSPAASSVLPPSVPPVSLPSSLLTAHFNFVPLWYFEATTGRLRFLPRPGALHGEEMAGRQWLVTASDALMIACSRAFLFKHYPLQAWLDYSQKFGLPGIRAITSAARGTPEFAAMEETLRTFMSELAVVTNTAESIDLIDLKGVGQPPFADIVERMDRVMAALWRGADLSTLSRDRGYGATLQEQESRILEQDDARLVSEHLNATIDRWVLEHLFGPSVEKLARLKILVTPQECTPHDLAIDQFLLQHGAKLSLSETMERYGRVQAKPGEEALQTPHPSTPRRSPPLRDEKSAFSAPNSAEPACSGGPAAAGPPFLPLAALCSADYQSASSKHVTKYYRPDPDSFPIQNYSMNSPTELRKAKLQNSAAAWPPAINTPCAEELLSPNSGVFEDHSTSPPDQTSSFDLRNSTLPGEPSFDLHPSPDGFLQLSPLGIFPHVRGFQNVDRPALETLVRNFNSFFARLGRRFAGIPFYIGHPDVRGYENIYTDRKAYGWIMDLQLREDGLYGRSKWSAAGRDLIANGHFKFLSPYWEAKSIGTKNGRAIFSPTVLISVGLTNEPNLPVLPLANSIAETGDSVDASLVGTPLPIASLDCSGGLRPPNLPQCSADYQSAPPLPKTEIPPGQEAPHREKASNTAFSPSPCLRGESIPNSNPATEPSFEHKIAQLETHLDDCQRQIATLSERLITSTLDHALVTSRILPVERSHWRDALRENFETASADLANSEPKLQLTARTANLERITLPHDSDQKQKQILSLVTDRMRATGLSYHQAWIETRTDHPELF